MKRFWIFLAITSITFRYFTFFLVLVTWLDNSISHFNVNKHGEIEFLSLDLSIRSFVFIINNQSKHGEIESFYLQINLIFLQNALNAQRVAGLIKTAETMGILDTSSESTKQSDIDEILGFLAALEKVRVKCNLKLSLIFSLRFLTLFRWLNDLEIDQTLLPERSEGGNKHPREVFFWLILGQF